MLYRELGSEVTPLTSEVAPLTTVLAVVGNPEPTAKTTARRFKDKYLLIFEALVFEFILDCESQD